MLTIVGWDERLRQVGAIQAFLRLGSICWKLEGSASISSPFHPRNLSKYSVLDRVSPSRAPHSTKKPFV